MEVGWTEERGTEVGAMEMGGTVRKVVVGWTEGGHKWEGLKSDGWKWKGWMEGGQHCGFYGELIIN